MVPVAALIFGADSAPVLAAAVAVMRLLPFVTNSRCTNSHREGQALRGMLVCYVASMLFYGTGHRPTFEGIQYGAAFVGIDDVSANDLAHFWFVSAPSCPADLLRLLLLILLLLLLLLHTHTEQKVCACVCVYMCVCVCVCVCVYTAHSCSRSSTPWVRGY